MIPIHHCADQYGDYEWPHDEPLFTRSTIGPDEQNKAVNWPKVRRARVVVISYLYQLSLWVSAYLERNTTLDNKLVILI